MRARAAAARALCLVALGPPAGLAACARAPEPRPRPAAPPRASASATLRFLFTSDEHGWIAPAESEGRARGGAAALLGRWLRDEGHCVPSASGGCEAAATLALSGGDNWTGPAVSSFFEGAPATEAMRRLGYAASALGNHEFDFGREALEKNAARQGFPFVAANVRPREGRPELARPFVVVERRGVRVGVVGLTLESAPRQGLRSNYEGYDFEPEGPALERAVPAAYAAGADVVVVVAHQCGGALAPIVERHPAWGLGFVGAGHCHEKGLRWAGAVPVVEAGAYLGAYARVELVVAKAPGARAEVTGRDVKFVDLTYPPGASPPAPPDAALAAEVASWQAKVDAALGEVVGHAGEPLPAESPALVNLVADAWREAASADVAVLGRFTTRQGFNPGPISHAAVFSTLPFVNRLVTVHITGAELLDNLACCGGHVAGLERGEGGRVTLAGGAPLEPGRRYRVVTSDYAYAGGSDYLFGRQDPSPRFGESIREPVLRWLRARPTSPSRGLERLVDRRDRLGTSGAPLPRPGGAGP
ncbi:MAG TPA: 5'-nucleotidase C-terminal domain-containing protein [Polyangiaceae bacterium]|nr:5'-nucleotidase C-terminal domain-containing protein [Polyangiaceae bacterium]